VTSKPGWSRSGFTEGVEHDGQSNRFRWLRMVGGRAANSRELTKRLCICALGYLLPVLVIPLSIAG
jgi:hypothetical protein